VFWRVQHYFPHDQRFAADGFGFQPIWLILQALEYGAKLHSEQLHLQELGIATLSALFANANRDPKKGMPASPSDFFYFSREERPEVEIPALACDIFFALIAEEKLPEWVLNIAPIENLRKCRSKNPPAKFPRPRVWVGDDLVLILPRVDSAKEVSAMLSFNNGTCEVVELQDIDTDTSFFLRFSEPSEAMWSLDAQFERV
jgi:hypothetical protein